jgi:uncharacterized protein YbbC (DUF1343 family)
MGRLRTPILLFQNNPMIQKNLEKAVYILFVLLGLISLWGCPPGSRQQNPENSQPAVKPGVEVFLENYLHLVQRKRIGFVTNPTGVNRHLVSDVELFHRHPDIQLTALYGPEHGTRGNAQAGEYVPFIMDETYGLPVFSLYGQTQKPDPGMLKNIDHYMRSFDTDDTGKIPEKHMIGDIDIMIFDIQDVGTRIYTYIATMAFCMQSCAEAGIPFVVLDRPNPINGISMEGPILDYPEYSSFVGLYPVPVRHGMTAGELARMFNDLFLEKPVDLHVIPMQNWDRTAWFDETGLPWVMPSPNMPTLDTAAVYPGQVFLEGTNVSEGRGTTRPFELFGAPWIDGHELAKKLNELKLDGILFREAWFSPVFSKYTGELCGGCQIHILNRKTFQPWESTIHIIQTIMQMYPEDFKFHPEYFDKIMGTARVRTSLLQGIPADNIAAEFQADIEEFAEKRKKYLLY